MKSVKIIIYCSMTLAMVACQSSCSSKSTEMGTDAGLEVSEVLEQVDVQGVDGTVLVDVPNAQGDSIVSNDTLVMGIDSVQQLDEVSPADTLSEASYETEGDSSPPQPDTQTSPYDWCSLTKGGEPLDPGPVMLEGSPCSVEGERYCPSKEAGYSEYYRVCTKEEDGSLVWKSQKCMPANEAQENYTLPLVCQTLPDKSVECCPTRCILDWDCMHGESCNLDLVSVPLCFDPGRLGEAHEALTTCMNDDSPLNQTAGAGYFEACGQCYYSFYSIVCPPEPESEYAPIVDLDKLDPCITHWPDTSYPYYSYMIDAFRDMVCQW